MSEATVATGPAGVNIRLALGLLSKQDIIDAFGVDQRTITRWEAAGLKPRRPGTQHVYYLRTEVEAIFALDASEIPKYQPRYQRGDEKRKPKRK